MKEIKKITELINTLNSSYKKGDYLSNSKLCKSIIGTLKNDFAITEFNTEKFEDHIDDITFLLGDIKKTLAIYSAINKKDEREKVVASYVSVIINKALDLISYVKSPTKECRETIKEYLKIVK